MANDESLHKTELKLNQINPVVGTRLEPFLEEVGAGLPRPYENIQSIYLVGSAVTKDFDDDVSDINTVFVLKEMDFKLLEIFASLGGKYGKKKIAPPLIMTPSYITDSLDVFPLEFLEIKLIHQTLFGEDHFSGINVEKQYLRLQCERELKSRLIGLRQGYLYSKGNPDLLTEGLVKLFTGSFPLFRGILVLFGKEPSINKSEVISSLCNQANISPEIFEKVLAIKNKLLKVNKVELQIIFEKYYEKMERLTKIVDEINAL